MLSHQMTFFIPSPPLPHRPHLAQASRIIVSRPRANSNVKRLRISSQDRSTEFSQSPHNSNPPSPPPTDPIDWTQWTPKSPPIQIPALPFPPTDVFMPGELKRLHLYEARYLALFETVIVQYNKRCAHVLIDHKRDAMAAYAVMLHIHSWRRLDLGVSVQVEAIGRLKLLSVQNPAPFLTGKFQCVEDNILDESGVQTARNLETRLWNTFREAVRISVKIGQEPLRHKTEVASAEPDETNVEGVETENTRSAMSESAKCEVYEQKLKQGVRRAAGLQHIDFGEHADDDMVRKRTAALSFAAWDFFPSQTVSRQRAIEQRDTLTRLATICHALDGHISTLAAKLAVREAFVD